MWAKTLARKVTICFYDRVSKILRGIYIYIYRLLTFTTYTVNRKYKKISLKNVTSAYPPVRRIPLCLAIANSRGNGTKYKHKIVLSAVKGYLLSQVCFILQVKVDKCIKSRPRSNCPVHRLRINTCTVSDTTNGPFTSTW